MSHQKPSPGLSLEQMLIPWHALTPEEQAEVSRRHLEQCFGDGLSIDPTAGLPGDWGQQPKSDDVER